MKQSIYIECYEGLSARMLTEALLDLMPEGKAARKLVVGLRKLSCSEAARQEMLHNMQERIHELPCLRMRNDYLPVHTGSG